MAAGGLLALLDDITAILDDIALMTKVAAAKTAGITGDDLAVNAQTLVGIDPKRELPIVWRVAKGSFRNKLILVPSALILSVIAPWAITPLLMVGGAYLCFEAAEKILHAKQSKADRKHKKELHAAAAKSARSLLAMEEEKIAQAVNTDFILSAEIVAVALGAVEKSAFVVKTAVLCGVGVAMTVGVYGLVAGIVKLDDLGMHLAKKKNKTVRAFGKGLVKAAPKLMKVLTVVGTAAMFMVGGGIILHGIPALAETLQALSHSRIIQGILTTLAGVAVGFAVIPLAHELEQPVKRAGATFKKLFKRSKRKR